MQYLKKVMASKILQSMDDINLLIEVWNQEQYKEKSLDTIVQLTKETKERGEKKIFLKKKNFKNSQKKQHILPSKGQQQDWKLSTRKIENLEITDWYF